MAVLICPVKPGDHNEELRYSLRSWDANLLPGEDKFLVVVGDCPSWVKPDHFIKGNHTRLMDRVVFENVLLGAEYAVHQGLSEIIVMNDDMFCLDPVTDVPKVRRNISLKAHAGKVRGGSWWSQSLDSTVKLAELWGRPDASSYEVHRPLVAASEEFVAALNAMRDHVDVDGDEVLGRGAFPQWRTAFGLHRTGRDKEYIPVRDVKVSGNSNPRVGSPWISTDDSSWRYLGPAIRKRFQNPSRWEK